MRVAGMGRCHHGDASAAAAHVPQPGDSVGVARFRAGGGRGWCQRAAGDRRSCGRSWLGGGRLYRRAMAAGIASLEFELVAEELALDRWWAITLAAAAAGLAVL